MGGLEEAVLERAFGDVVRAMGEADGEGSLRGWVRSARGLELAARPVDWITLKCCCTPSGRDLELCRVRGELWDRAGGEGEQGKGTKVGGLETRLCGWLSLLSWGSAVGTAECGLSVFPVPELAVEA